MAAARRWQGYALRAALVFVLLGALGIVYLNFRGDWLITGGKQVVSLGDYARIGAAFVDAILGTQLALILLVAPAATAGAICIEKARGNLTLLMATDLSSSEIILGKLLARLWPVLLLVTTSLPVLFIATMMGGVNVDQLVLGFMVLIGAAVFGCSLALCLSVHVGRTQEALLVSYGVLLIWLLAFPIAWVIRGLFALGTRIDWLALSNPYVLLFEPSTPTFGATFNNYVGYLVVTIGCSSLLVLLSIIRLRRTVLHQIHRVRKSPRRKGNRRAQARKLNRDALRWYEQHRRRPSRAVRIAWLLYVLMGLGCAVGVYFERQTAGMFRWSASPVNALLVSLGLLLSTIGAATALADERTRGSLDILLLTPVRSGAVLWAKWRTAFYLVPKLLVIPFVVGLVIVGIGQLFILAFSLFDWSFRNHTNDRLWVLPLMVIHPLACGAMLVSLGLLLATWLKKFGRAIGVAVGMYVFLVLVWPITAQMVLGNSWGADGLAMLSPGYTAGILTQMLEHGYYGRYGDELFFAAWFTTFVFLVFAIFFYVLTWIIFDRKMGRISRERPVLMKDRSIWTKPVFGHGMRNVVEWEENAIAEARNHPSLGGGL
jgi:ABC-type transport system involved in multi-copper enzyme maturation permease subunit